MSDIHTPISDEMHRRLVEARLPSGTSAIAISAGPADIPQSTIPGFISEQQFADQLGLKLSTIRRWRRRGYGPKFVKIGRKDYCRENAAAEFATEQLAKAEAAASPRGRGRPRAA